MPVEPVPFCGTGSWNGPKPGDPDNGITLSASAVHGGIAVSWTMPATNPHAVAYFNLYRGVTTNPVAKLLLAVVSGNSYFDQSPDGTPPRFYYWLEVVSVNGTVGDLIGPATAQAFDTISDLITRLTGQIDEGLLSNALKSEIARIEILNQDLLAEIASRINDGGQLAQILEDVQAEVAEAVTYIYSEIQTRADADAAILNSYNILAAALNGSIAALAEEVNLIVLEGVGVTAEQLSTLSATIYGDIGTLQALVTSNATASATADGLLASDIAQVAADYAGVEATVTSEATARATADTALATAITTAQSTLDGQIAAVQTLAETSINDLTGEVYALYTAKVNVNGLVGGFGLANDGASVEAGFDVDTFWVGRTALDKKKPFIISGGVVYIDSAMINKLTADQIDTRGLTIKALDGTVLFGAGTGLEWSAVGGTGKPEDGATRNVFRGAWAQPVAYDVGDTVTKDGQSYTALTSHVSSVSIKPPDPPTEVNTQWALTSAKGAQGEDGADGLNGTRTAILDLYIVGTSTPVTFPSGNSTYTWATGQFTLPGTPNGWALTPPTPGAGETLWVARTLHSDNLSSATTVVAWVTTVATPAGAAGATGADGSNGTRTAFLEVYRWSATTPVTFPSGTSTYTWATGAFTAPTTANSWSLTPGAAVTGQTLWGCSVRKADSLTDATTSVTWSTSVAYAVGAAGNDGIDGISPIQAILSNEAHTLPATNLGAVTSYVGSGTEIRLYEGATVLNYDGVGTSNGSWKIASTSPTNITVGSLTDSGTYLTVGAHSGVANGTDTSQIIYNISCKTCNGSAFTITKTQSFSKSKAGSAGAPGADGAGGSSVLILTSVPPKFTSTDGTLDGAQPSITFTAAVEGIASPSYVWSFTGLQYPPSSSGTSVQVITAAQFGTSKAALIMCTVNGAYTDLVSIYRLEKSTAEAGATVGATPTQVTNIAAAAATAIWGSVTGTGKPENYATAGATFGTNIFGQITPANVGTYIQSAAIGSAYIANAAITSAKIGDLQVTSLKIGSGQVITDKLATESVTIPRGIGTASSMSVGASGNHSIQAMSVTSTGAPVSLFVSALLTAKVGNPSMTSFATHTVKVLIAGSEVYSAQVFSGSREFADYLTEYIPFSAMLHGVIGAGVVFIELRVVTTGNSTSTSNVTMRSMVFLETKR